VSHSFIGHSSFDSRIGSITIPISCPISVPAFKLNSVVVELVLQTVYLLAKTLRLQFHHTLVDDYRTSAEDRAQNEQHH